MTVVKRFWRWYRNRYTDKGDLDSIAMDTLKIVV